MGIFRIQGQPKRKWYILVVLLVFVTIVYIWLVEFNKQSPLSPVKGYTDIESYLIQQIPLNTEQVRDLDLVWIETDSLRNLLGQNKQLEQSRMEAEMKLKTHDAQVIKHANTITAYEVLLNKLNREQTNKIGQILEKDQLNKLTEMTGELALYFQGKSIKRKMLGK
jgi:hypothetical protein